MPSRNLLLQKCLSFSKLEVSIGSFKFDAMDRKNLLNSFTTSLQSSISLPSIFKDDVDALDFLFIPILMK